MNTERRELSPQLRQLISTAVAQEMRFESVLRCFEAALLEGNLPAAAGLRKHAHDHLELLLDAKAAVQALARKQLG